MAIHVFVSSIYQKIHFIKLHKILIIHSLTVKGHSHISAYLQTPKSIIKNPIWSFQKSYYLLIWYKNVALLIKDIPSFLIDLHLIIVKAKRMKTWPDIRIYILRYYFIRLRYLQVFKTVVSLVVHLIHHLELVIIILKAF